MIEWAIEWAIEWVIEWAIEWVIEWVIELFTDISITLKNEAFVLFIFLIINDVYNSKKIRHQML